jgi:uncharacterized protein YecT (DUF1311 family)
MQLWANRLTRRGPSLDNTVMKRRFALVLIAIVIVGSLAQPQSQSDPVAPLAGTWGQPPVDGKPGLTGSIFTAYRDSGGGSRIALTFAPPPGWTCSLEDQAVSWRESERRFEWPNQSTRVKAPTCWLQAEPHGDVLDVRMFCPYTCTRAEEVNTLQLSRMAATHLVAPKTVVNTFCSSPDPLRHAMCTPGTVQDRIAEGDRLGNQVKVLADRFDAKNVEPETELVLLGILERCHAAKRDVSCVSEELRGRITRLQQQVSARQQALETEQKLSESYARPLPDAKPPTGWDVTRHLVTDEVIGSLELSSCDKVSCSASLLSETNYTFGYGGRQGTCSIDAPVKFTDAETAFGYVAIAESDQNEWGAGQFANFCRMDLKRGPEGIAVTLRGTGCQEWCSESHYPELAGRYKEPISPSFACSDPESMPWDEKIVCLDPTLATLDRELATAFAKARAAAKGTAATALASSQRGWLKERREECDADRRYSCVKELYQKRITELTARGAK